MLVIPPVAVTYRVGALDQRKFCIFGKTQNFFAEHFPCLALFAEPVHHAAGVKVIKLILILVILLILLRRIIMTNTPGGRIRHSEWQPYLE